VPLASSYVFSSVDCFCRLCICHFANFPCALFLHTIFFGFCLSIHHGVCLFPFFCCVDYLKISEMSTNPVLRRLMRELQDMNRKPIREFRAAPLEDNLFEWHFTMEGPPDSPYAGGIYHGRVLIPTNYPFAPPDVVLLTPNGRFELDKRICLSISSYHPENWRSSWGVSTVLHALRQFMLTPGNNGIGAIEYPAEKRAELAAASAKFVCPHCGRKAAEEWELMKVALPATEADKQAPVVDTPALRAAATPGSSASPPSAGGAPTPTPSPAAAGVAAAAAVPVGLVSPLHAPALSPPAAESAAAAPATPAQKTPTPPTPLVAPAAAVQTPTVPMTDRITPPPQTDAEAVAGASATVAAAAAAAAAPEAVEPEAVPAPVVPAAGAADMVAAPVVVRPRAVQMRGGRLEVRLPLESLDRVIYGLWVLFGLALALRFVVWGSVPTTLTGRLVEDAARYFLE
jgi:ubiquitin-conjugating enzyme E2 J1